MVAVALPATPAQAATLEVGPGKTYTTISAAITAAVAGDIIIVDAGTYTEDLIIDKDITLRSASGAASTIIQLVDGVGIDIQAAGAGCTIGGASNQGFTIAPHATATTFDIQLTNAPSGVNISYNTIGTVGGATMGISIGSAGATGLTVSYNTFAAEAGDGSIWGPIMVNVTISNNTFTGPGSTTSGYAVQFSGVTGTSTISGNTITGYGTGVLVSHGEGTSGLTISNNTITGCSSGMRFAEYKATGGPDGNMTTVTITGNTLSTNTIGLRVDNGAHVLASNFTIQYNKFTGNTTYGLQNNHATEVVTANSNWWGANDGPDDDAGVINGSGDKISLNVTVANWLSVIVTDPAAGACVKGGSSYLVQWTAHSVASANAAFSVYNGTTWVDAGSQGGTFNGSYSTSVAMPSVNSSNCKVKVTISGGGGPTYSAESGVFRIDSAVPTVSLGSIAPCLKGGSTVSLTFNVGDTGSTSLGFVIQYTIDGTNFLDILPTASFTEAPGTKTKSWTVPSENSNACKWRVTATDCAGNATTATSTGTFIIDSTAPTATLSYPLGGQTLTAGTTISVTFSGSDALSPNLTYTVRHSIDSGANWISSTSENTTEAVGARTRSWLVPSINSTTVRLGVWTTDCAGNTSVVSPSTSDITISDTTLPVVTVVTPNGGESWAAGSTQTVRWTATDDVAGTLNIKIFYTFDYPTENPIWESPPGGIGAYAQGAGSYLWTVPTPLATKTTCRLKIEATDAALNAGSDMSNNDFTIALSTSAPTVQVTYPNGGETLQGGTCQTITWTASDPSDPTWLLNYALEYWHGGAWVSIATLSNRDQGSQSYCWAVPTPGAATYLVRVSATGPGGTASDQSDAAFTVTAADAAVTAATVTLKQGWNLISLELMPTCVPSTTTTVTGYPIESVMSDALARISGVWYFTGGASGTWQSWAPGAPSSLKSVTDGKAYWVLVSTGANIPFTYQGRKGPAGGGFPTTPYAYVVGWNMVGFKSTITKHMDTYLGGTCGTTYLSPMYSWDAATQAWTTPSTFCGDNMNPDSGYWVNFNVAHTVNAGAD